MLVSRKSNEDDVRWVYLDIGKFGGLAETMDESIRYAIRRRATARDSRLRARRPDLRLSADVMYEGAVSAAGEPGDRRQGADRGTGAYTATYSAVAFNGFAPLKTASIYIAGRPAPHCPILRMAGTRTGWS